MQLSHNTIIVASGHSGMEEGAQCMKLGAFDVLEKPIQFKRDREMSVLRKAIIHQMISGCAVNDYGKFHDMTTEIIMEQRTNLNVDAMAREMRNYNRVGHCKL